MVHQTADGRSHRRNSVKKEIDLKNRSKVFFYSDEIMDINLEITSFILSISLMPR